MVEKDLLEFMVLMEIEKYRRKYQWWQLSGISILVFGLFMLFSLLGEIGSNGYYSIFLLIYIAPPVIVGTIVSFQGMRMRITYKEMLYKIEMIRNPDSNISLEEFKHSL